ncbi:galactofuranosylgalactofuranosylrhamnosyl-N-acetylglucosaminyl-diphospho-decaprenol beta-1,5/1,6-galactofuranosyltransferase [Nocardioides terrae]|uniref:Galactofuranosylgalactofuranosylrhamnosyl-N-acetylglucosaminyl-diphospho-decaprenol beta-1,5/1,6-galactofuranosyltransferase n=1 Tax=Nocardioides terrae TaxID=574651 RepID=A0A1I1DMN8_9ACTN|nr:galactofuranosylgalactofuranosylrhamnosyl-N-acetylglucosaminyl-diphospho-decaprenol beta-1,5/1,6-galactofuranosyltransferase [Nocardioides terrae]
MTVTKTSSKKAKASAEASTVTRLLQRQIMPVDRELDAIALYVDLEEIKLDASKYEVGGNRSAKDLNNAAIRQSTSTGRAVHPDQLLSRTAFRIPAGERVSFGSYFNAFPASYWRRWTVVSDVTLTLVVKGSGATVVVNKSTSDGRSQKVDAATVEGDSQTLTFDLSLKPFVDGGWYWYDVAAGTTDAVVESAEWTAEVPADRAEHGTIDMAITTMNRPDFCAKLLGQLGTEEVLPYLDTVFVMEQGSKTQLVRDSEFFPDAEKGLQGRLRVIEQGNLGGSGGYARGQLESVRKGTATYTLLMDDDVECEPEGIIRAVTFGDLCRRPTLVGGHMFSLYAKSRLHSFGEIVQPWRFWWQTPLDGYSDWDLSARNIRSSRWLHKRVDVDFNGWYMCLIPRQVIEEIGLSLPLFIKWDDSEYGLRAKEAGYPTVTFPGAAVWHIPWGDKNDAVDWQAYFHLRNRFIAALLHSPYPKGGRLIRESLNHQIAHLVSMQYSTAELRLRALEDVLAGPEALHGMLAGKLTEINTFRKQFTDAQLHTDRDDLPPVKRTKPPRKGKDVVEVPGRLSSLISAGVAPIRHAVKPPRDLSRDYPEAEIRAMDAKWWKLASYDSAVVSMNDGSSTALYKRDLGAFRDLMKRTLALHERYRREWPALAQRYRAALGDITSPESWEQTFRPWTETDQESGS